MAEPTMKSPEMKESLLIIGKVVEKESQRGVSSLRVEAWDKDLVFDDLVGSTDTALDGTFQMKIDSGYFQEIFLDRKPDLFFKVFLGEELVQSTEDAVLWNLGSGTREVLIELDTSLGLSSWGWKMANSPEDMLQFLNGTGAYKKPVRVARISGIWQENHLRLYAFYQRESFTEPVELGEWGWKLATSPEDVMHFLRGDNGYSWQVRDTEIASVWKGDRIEYYVFYKK